MTSRTGTLSTITSVAAYSRGRDTQSPEALAKARAQAEFDPNYDYLGTLDEQMKRYDKIAGTPKTMIGKLRYALEYVCIGTIMFWDGDGATTHDLSGPFEMSPATNEPSVFSAAGSG